MIGYPLRYTLSPSIHNYVFRKLGVDAMYVPLRVSPEKLHHFLEVARESLAGFNVTMPHKTEVAKELDWASREVVETGSVNTVHVINGRLHGYNTDYRAIVNSLRERGYGGGPTLMIGAGGVARAALIAVRDLGCRIVHVVNRTRERALELCRESQLGGLDCQVMVGDDVAGDYELLINATPLGTGENDELPINLGRMRPRIVLDLPYKPKGDTALTAWARGRGLLVIDGIEILIRQALEADRIWLGMEVNMDWREVRRVITESHPTP